ncbi:MAG: hypothetical protein E7461_07990 [Ruminococcaceae bacterium]|nr:hypothetical protein [Oscillospiraceae bacterium]
MKKLYEEFFAIPEDGNVPEKVMLTRAVLTVAVILVCLSAMGITAYAYFSHSLTSSQNAIKTADFGTNISIQNADPAQEPVQIEQTDKKVQKVTLLAGNTYNVTIQKTGTATTGFCKISALGDDDTVYHTQQLGAEAITFTLTVTNTTKVSFSANWGTSSYYAAYAENGENHSLYILNGESVVLS